MVAYNFNPRFADDVQNLIKRQTIRANGKRRHARPGDELQLYTGQRRPECRLLLRTTCAASLPIVIYPNAILADQTYSTAKDLDVFANLDGFTDWSDMLCFFETSHELSGANHFNGTLIKW
ncbi:ASCH domain-containing protein [Roseobacter sp. TSBP12]|uniref:ASCH domain-containing protein n=1 Tax=Roseobacter sp. TSBP12 TaxID=1236613 RepID=UPI00125F1FDC|nr:ASCH domain-containing protein [Roseobacter sp. TSBP12]KAB6714289.1 hypothetical protein C8029_21355 [Roseobacter sp. TSBP12]